LANSTDEYQTKGILSRYYQSVLTMESDKQDCRCDEVSPEHCWKKWHPRARDENGKGAQ